MPTSAIQPPDHGRRAGGRMLPYPQGPVGVGLGLLAMLVAACGSSSSSPSTSRSTAASGIGATAVAATTYATVPAAPAATTTTMTTIPRLPPRGVAAIPVDPGDAPAAISAAGGSIWVATHHGSTLYRIDPRTNRILARINMGESTCFPATPIGGDRLIYVNCLTPVRRS